MRKLKLKEFKWPAWDHTVTWLGLKPGIRAYKYHALLPLNFFLVLLFSLFPYLLSFLPSSSFPLFILPFSAAPLTDPKQVPPIPHGHLPNFTHSANSADQALLPTALTLLPWLPSSPCASRRGVTPSRRGVPPSLCQQARRTPPPPPCLLTAAVAVGRGLQNWGLRQPGGKPDLWGVM